MLYIDKRQIKQYIRDIEGKHNHNIFKYILCVSPIINSKEDIIKYLDEQFIESVSYHIRPSNHEALLSYTTYADIENYFNWLYQNKAESVL